MTFKKWNWYNFGMVDKFNDKFLKKKGVDAHYVKGEFSCYPFGRYDIYNGNTITIRSKDGRKVIDTEMTPDEFFEAFGNGASKERSYE